jgi:hypothetical protein
MRSRALGGGRLRATEISAPHLVTSARRCGKILATSIGAGQAVKDVSCAGAKTGDEEGEVWRLGYPASELRVLTSGGPPDGGASRGESSNRAVTLVGAGLGSELKIPAGGPPTDASTLPRSIEAA